MGHSRFGSTIIGLEVAARHLPNLVCVVELETLQQIVNLGRHDVVPNLPMLLLP
jgi:hypothetical protein